VSVELTLQVADGLGEPVPACDAFRAWADAALAGRRERAELCVRVVDVAEGEALNARYRGKAYATNVLSFPAELPPELGLPLLGDLVLCAPVVLREAHEQGKPADAHWAHLTVHGVLHLLGFDHVHPDEAETMEALERAVLARCGYPDPYQCTTQTEVLNR